VFIPISARRFRRTRWRLLHRDHQNKELPANWPADRGIDKIAAEFREEAARSCRSSDAGTAYRSAVAFSVGQGLSVLDERPAPRGMTCGRSDREAPNRCGTARRARYQAMPLRPIDALFRVYHYNCSTTRCWPGRDRGQGGAELLGVIYQSNWQHEMDYGAAGEVAALAVLRSISAACATCRTGG